MTSLQELGAKALSGSGGTALVSGEAGIGKSRLVYEYLLSDDTSQVIRAVGYSREVEGAPVYWPWFQLLREIEHSSSRSLPAILSSLDRTKPENQDNSRQNDRTLDQQIHVELLRYLKAVSISKPLVAVIEDIHWADTPTLRALEFVAGGLKNCKVMLIVTIRDPEQVASSVRWTLGELSRVQGLLRLELQPLDPASVTALMEGHVENPKDVTPATFEFTGGNPLYVTEITRLIDRIDATDLLGVRLPSTTTSIIENRTKRVPPDTAQLIETAAVLGRELEPELICNIMNIAGSEYLRRLQPALDLGILENPVQLGSPVRFHHEIVRQVILQGLSASNLAQLHLTAAKALELFRAHLLEPYAGTIAFHYRNAQPLVEDAPVFKYSRLAGEYELASFAYPEARVHLETAVEILAPGIVGAIKEEDELPIMDRSPTPLSEWPVTRELAEILASLARAYAGDNEDDLALICMKASFDRFLELDDEDECMRVASFPLSVMSPASTALYEKGVQIAKAGTPERALVLSRWGTVFSGIPHYDYDRAVTLLDRAIKEAESLQNPWLIAWNYGRAAMVHHHHNKWKEAERTARIAFELRDQYREPECAVHVAYWGAMCLTTLGQLATAGQYASLAWDTAVRSRHAIRLWQGASASGIHLVQSGDVAGAAQRFDEAISRAKVGIWPLLLRFLSRAQLAQEDEGGEPLFHRANVTDRFFPLPMYAAMLVRAASDCNINPLGWDQLISMLLTNHPLLNLPFHRIAVESSIALAGVEVGDQALAKRGYVSLQPLAGSIPTTNWAYPYSADRVLGRTAAFLGRHADAELHFQNALKILRPNGYRFEQAWTCHDYAEYLTRIGRRRQARKLLEEGLKIAQDCGLSALSVRLTALQGISELAPSGLPFDLTPREVEVLELVSEGKTNREISGLLFITGNTVATHLKNILSKTNSSTRIEAARKYMDETIR